jgi:hypothetical protein
MGPDYRGLRERIARKGRDEVAAAVVRALPEEDAWRLGRAGLAALRAIIAGRWIWSKVRDLPGRYRVAYKLHACGWVDLWRDHPEALHVTLSLEAVGRLGVAIDEFGIVEYREDREEGSPTIDIPELQEFDRWVPAAAVREHFFMPRTKGIAELPVPDLPAPEPEPEPEPAPMPTAPIPPTTPAERRKILGVFVAELKQAKGSKKRKKCRPPKR